MIKTLFQTGARVDEFVHIRVEDLLWDEDPPQIHIIHAERAEPIATCQYCRRWPMNFALISTGAKLDFYLRATATRAIRPEWCNRLSPTVPAPQA
jgi:hypothetical protein